MENENLFSETEEALFNKIKRICDNMSNEIKGNDSMDNLSFNSFSGTFSLSTDVLSNLSDISSIPTYQFSNPYAKKKEFHTPQIEKKKRRKYQYILHQLKNSLDLIQKMHKRILNVIVVQKLHLNHQQIDHFTENRNPSNQIRKLNHIIRFK